MNVIADTPKNTGLAKLTSHTIFPDSKFPTPDVLPLLWLLEQLVS